VNNNLIKEIGRSYIVSSFLPTALFVSVGIFLFYRDVSPLLGLPADDLSSLFPKNWVILLIVAMWVAFFLYSAVDVIFKF
jgi:hypothetical protein